MLHKVKILNSLIGILLLLVLFQSCSGGADGGGDGDTENGETAGKPDSEFDIGTGPNGNVNVIVEDSNGKILVGGDFTSFNNQPLTALVRLNSDGSFDTGFNMGTGLGKRNGLSPWVETLALQDGGKIVIGGYFGSCDGVTCGNIVRLNEDGSVDNSFDSSVGTDSTTVCKILAQNDGKLIIAGCWSYNSVRCNYLVRVNQDGSLDDTFDSGDGFASAPSDMILQSDGKIIVVGGFDSYDNHPSNKITRINSDGSWDSSFDSQNGPDKSSIETCTLTKDGKILLVGGFNTYSGYASPAIVRINTNGSVDTTFRSLAEMDTWISDVCEQGNDRILLGGWFVTYDGRSRNRVVRLLSNGDLDTSFDPGQGFEMYEQPYCIIQQSSGKILMGGNFTEYDGQFYRHLIRVTN